MDTSWIAPNVGKILQTSVVIAGVSKLPLRQLVKAEMPPSSNAGFENSRKPLTFPPTGRGFSVPRLKGTNFGAWLDRIKKAENINAMDTT
jgi:hypothetical protein